MVLKDYCILGLGAMVIISIIAVIDAKREAAASQEVADLFERLYNAMRKDEMWRNGKEAQNDIHHEDNSEG